MRRATPAILAALLFIITAAVFAGVLGADFVRWDDNVSIFENKHLGGFSMATITWAFTDIETLMRYAPLSLLGWVATYQVFELDPLGYHLGNYLLHCANVVLLFVVMTNLLSPRRETDEPPPASTLIAAAVGAMLWGLHPMRVEPVAWCTGRTYDQALFFLLTAAWCYLRASVRVNPLGWRTVWYWAAVGAYLASLLSHPIGLGFVAVLLVMDVIPLREASFRWRWWRKANTWRCLMRKIPFVAAAVLVLALSLAARFHHSAVYSGQSLPLSAFGIHKRLLQASYMWAYYAWKPWWPVHLTPMRTELIDFSALDWPFIASAIGVVVLTVLLFMLRRRWPALLALWLFHLCILIPALGWTEHPHYPADRYALLPGIAWPLGIAAAMAWIARHRRRLFVPATMAAVMTCALLGALSVRQIGIWQNSCTLYDHMLTILGDSPYRSDIYGRIGLLHILARPQELDAAEEAFKKGVQANPGDFRVRLLLADLWTRQHRHNAAVLLLRDGLRLTPDSIDLRVQLGITLLESTRYSEADDEFSEILRRQPDNAAAKIGVKAAREMMLRQRGEGR